MKLSNLPILLFLLFNLSISFAQNEIKIEGKVVEEGTNIPLEYATITLKTTTDNKIITGGITDADGKFRIEVPSGTYNIYVEYISYITKEYLNKTLAKSIDLGTVSLALDIASLDEVTVIAEKTTVEIKLDKKIYNVGKDLTVRGGTVSDVLDNVPSVSVDVEGTVSLRGNDDVRILINGKPSGLVGLNSTDALRQLPAESIERVEVITSPSARYDAEGTAGILNIILRRSKLQGLNGAVTVNGGYPWQAGISGNLNYRTGDLNFFNTSGYNYREVPGNSYTRTEFFNGDDPNTISTEDRNFDRVRKGLNTNFGLEWYVNETSSLTAALVYRDSDNQSNTTNNTLLVDENGTILERFLRRDPEFEDDRNIQYSLNYDKQFNGDSQHKLTFAFQYEDSREVEESFIVNQSFTDNPPPIDEHVVTDENQEEILLQLDYVKPIGENGQFEFGYRGQFQNLNTDFLVEQFNNDTNTFENNTDLTNNLNFKQYINAFYSQYGNKIGKKFSYLLGLRYEGTRITIDQATSGDFNKKDFNQLFPTVNLAYQVSEKENFTLGYNRRIRRPRSRFLNPFPSRNSPTNLFQGNPNLNPSTSDAFDIGYLNKLEKLTLNGSVYYQHAKNIFSFVRRTTGETVNIGGTEIPVTARGPVNLATNDRYGGEITATYRPSRTFNLNANINLFHSVTKGKFEDQDFGAENFSWFARLNSKYTLPASIEWQTRIFYRGPNENAQNRRKGIFSVDLAFSKDLFDNKASLAFNINDVFNIRKFRTETSTPTFRDDNEFQWRERSFNLSFTYRFNQQKQRERDGRGVGSREDFDFEG